MLVSVTFYAGIREVCACCGELCGEENFERRRRLSLSAFFYDVVGDHSLKELGPVSVHVSVDVVSRNTRACHNFYVFVRPLNWW